MAHSIFRTLPYRYLGLGFPLAEALYFSYPEDHWMIDASYTIGGAFMVTHVLRNAIAAKLVDSSPKEVGLLTILTTAVGTLLWELMASVFMPSIIVHQISQHAQKHGPRDLPNLPTVVGIVSLQLIIYPLDSLTDMFIGLVVPQSRYVIQ